MTNTEGINADIVQWGSDKGILDRGTVDGQFRKTVSEVGELADALSIGDTAEIMDAVGDIHVTLVLLCELQGIDYNSCVKKAYTEISERTGTMVNGVLVKDGIATQTTYSIKSHTGSR